MSTELDSSHLPIELSEQDLEEVSGGFDVSFSMLISEQSSEFSVQQSGSKRSRRSSCSRSSRSFVSAIQFSGSGFQSMDDFMNVFSNLARLFGR